jgi:cell division protein FtsB
MMTHGNLALSPTPEPEEKWEDLPRRRLDSHMRLRRNREKASKINGLYALFLAGAMAVILYLCVSYIRIQFSLSSDLATIRAMEKRLETLTAQNDALQLQIDTSVDLGRVFSIATRELGMVYANEDQVVFYQQTESEYVRQYEDIPK